tara:strand:- start:181 stop:546 length:366 start_codon:yes stop_codon:yes gene_type:complete
MGTLKDIGNFQEGVGKVDADISVIGAWFIAVLIVIGAIVLAVMAFIPTKPADCLDDDKTERCQHKSKNSGFLVVSLLLLPLAYFVVWFAKWWKKEVYTNKTAAQIGGTMAEVNLVSQLFNR